MCSIMEERRMKDLETMRSESWGSFPGGMGGYERL